MKQHNRRHFLEKAGAITAAAFFSPLVKPVIALSLENPDDNHPGAVDAHLTQDEEYWKTIRSSFNVALAIINLNNGGVSPAPKIVQETMKKHYDYCNEAPSYYMWRKLDQGREPLRDKLANLAGCDTEEIAMNRNASEGLETIIFGLQLKAGDEVVLSKQDYPNIINAYRQRALRDGIRLVWINLELPSEEEDYLVQQYVTAFSAKTRLVHITHVINWNGQVLPVKKIAAAAHERGIEVVVDGAHSFAQLDFKIPDLGADYFATSLHKWLYAPVGTGMLYVKKEKIKTIYPLFASTGDPLKNDIRKFENLGTRPFFIEQAIHQAISFHEAIGINRKQERLQFLKQYWINKVKHLPGVQINTPTLPQWSCAIGNMGIQHKTPAALEAFLFARHQIHTVAIVWENINGVRITPNVYTSLKDLDMLVEGIEVFARQTVR